MPRDFMIARRERMGADIQTMAKKCEISKSLLELLENSESDVTHPLIAERIGKVYKLTPKQIEELMPEHHRKTSPNYNPDLYRRDDLEYADFAVMSGWRGKIFM